MIAPSGTETILVAEDDDDDCLLLRDAFQENKAAQQLRFVKDGIDLLDYLRMRGNYAAPGAAPRPSLILLDLNMPRKDGREALREIKADPALRLIPIVVLTTSRAEEDVHRSYELGVNSYICKPSTFDRLVEIARVVVRYWFQIVQRPPADRG